MKKPVLIVIVAVVLAIAVFVIFLPPPQLGNIGDPGSSISSRKANNPGGKKPEITMNTAIGKQRPGFKLKDLEGKVRNVSEWDGKVLVVNFWATWCPPCRKEMPLFVDLQKTYGEKGLQFVGIALDDIDAVQDFADNFEVNYPMLIGDNDSLQIAKDYGNHLGALPYTAIIDRKGKIVLTQPGEMRREQAEPTIKKLLRIGRDLKRSAENLQQN